MVASKSRPTNASRWVISGVVSVVDMGPPSPAQQDVRWCNGGTVLGREPMSRAEPAGPSPSSIFDEAHGGGGGVPWRGGHLQRLPSEGQVHDERPRPQS